MLRLYMGSCSEDCCTAWAEQHGKDELCARNCHDEAVMLNQTPRIVPNFFSDNDIVEASISFIENGSEYIFEIRYDAAHGEYLYERFTEVQRDRHKNIKHRVLLLRDIRNKEYTAEDETLMTAMKVASRNNLLIYLLDTESFPALNHVKETMLRLLPG